MDNEIFMINEDNGYSLILNKDEKKSWFVELLDTDQKIVFHHKCDTFVTGNLILHLQKAIKAFLKSHNKIGLSRWYPTVDAIFLISIDGPTYISPYIYKDSETEKCYIKFVVNTESVPEPITFVTSVGCVQDRIM